MSNGNFSIYPQRYKGATGSVAGQEGLVPPAAAGDQAKILSGAGTWIATPGGAIPSQTGHANEFLTTDGTNAAWGAVPLSGVTGILSASKGGTGINNGSNTLTLGAPVTINATSGATMNLAAINEIARTGQNFVFDGDSNTQGGSGPSPVSGGWPFPASTLSQISALGTYYNVGVGGYTTVDVIAHLTSAVFPLRPTGGVTRAMYTVLIGTNDITAIANAATTLTNLETIWSTVKGYGFVVVACTIQDRQDGGDPAIRAAINEGIRRSATWDLLLDVDRILPNAADSTYFQADKLHFKATANARVSREWNELAASRQSILKTYVPSASERLTVGLPMLNSAGALSNGVNITANDSATIPGVTLTGSSSAQQTYINTGAATGERVIQFNYPSTGWTIRQLNDAASALVRNNLIINPTTGTLDFPSGTLSTGVIGTTAGFSGTGTSPYASLVGSGDGTLLLGDNGATTGARVQAWRSDAGILRMEVRNDAGSAITYTPYSLDVASGTHQFAQTGSATNIFATLLTPSLANGAANVIAFGKSAGPNNAVQIDWVQDASASYMRFVHYGDSAASTAVDFVKGGAFIVRGTLQTVGDATFNANMFLSGTSQPQLSLVGTNNARVTVQDTGATTNTQAYSMFSDNGAYSLQILNDARNSVVSTPYSHTASTSTHTFTGTLAAATLTSTSNTSTGAITAFSGTTIPAGGTSGSGIKVSSATNFGIFFGSGAPTLSAAQGSLYLRSDGSGVVDRMYVNTNGTTGWTAVSTIT